MEQTRHHHTLHGTGLTNWRTDQETMTPYHQIRETKSLAWIHLATERKSGHQLETRES